MTHLSDADLVTRALHGDATAFGTLVELYQHAVYGVCVSLVHDFDLAQDLAQDTFLKAFQHLSRLAMPTHFGSWLRVIAANACRLSMRQARSAQALGRVHYAADVPGVLSAMQSQPDWLLTHNTIYFTQAVSRRTGLRIATPRTFFQALAHGLKS
jgi:RNA polymerase sigma factor (sigma-70 family)